MVAGCGHHHLWKDYAMTPLSLMRMGFNGAGTTAPGQEILTGSGNWTVPAGVTSVSLVGVGRGGAGVQDAKAGRASGGGGELRYLNNMSVTPGQIIAYVVGTVGTGNVNTTFNSTSLVANGGTNGPGGAGGSGGTGTGGGNGGAGVNYPAGGGGGAGGYSGAGGAGGNNGAGNNGAGGGGGGGGGGASGGGVGLLGEGSNGAGGANTFGGGGGSGGDTGGDRDVGAGGLYGGGSSAARPAAHGGLRIIWPGDVRTFPSTRTADE